MRKLTKFLPVLALAFSLQMFPAHNASADDVGASTVRLSQAEYEQLLARAKNNGPVEDAPGSEPMVRITYKEYSGLIKRAKAADAVTQEDKPFYKRESFLVGCIAWLCTITLYLFVFYVKNRCRVKRKKV